MQLIDFETKLKSATNVNTLNKVLAQYLAELQILTFAFTYYSYHPNSHNKLKYDYASANFSQWHKHYLEEGYEDIDSTLEVVYHTTLPTFWDIQQQLKEAKSEREKQMRLDSIKFGVEKGLSIPIHGPQEDFAILLVTQMHGETCLENWRGLQYELFTAAYYYYFYLQNLLLLQDEPAQKYLLSKRELQCLQLIAKQYSVKKIAETLHITERTANYHIQRLNKKLGTQNKYQSLMKAIQKGLIKP